MTLTDTSACYHHIVTSTWVRQTHRHAIIILLLRQTHLHAIITSTYTSSCYHLVTSTDTSACYHHLVSSTDTLACYHHLVTRPRNPRLSDAHTGRKRSLAVCIYDNSGIGNCIHPKRRFGQEEQKMKSGFRRKHFSIVRSPNRALTPLKSASFEILISSFVPPDQIFVWGV